ncbi:hypothetical protein AVEN_158688-1, partial [Araneus ventricosus]
IYRKAGPTCLTRLDRNHVLPVEPVLGSCFHITLRREPCSRKVFATQIGFQIWAVGGWLQTFLLNFRSHSSVLRAVWALSCRRMAPSLHMPGRLHRMASRWPSDYFLFPKWKEHLSGRRFSSESDVKTAAENWLSGQGRDFCPAESTSCSCVQINA